MMLANIRSVSTRIQLGSALILVVAIAVIVPVVLGKIGSLVSESEKQTLDGHYRTLVSQIGAEARRAETVAVVLAKVPEFQKAMAEGQRERLGEMLLPAFAELKKNHALTQMQYNLPPAISFIRLHHPEKYGDDLSSIRHTIVKANTERVAVTGIETGVSGLGIRGMVPVFHQGRHIGSVEVGTSFGQPFFERFKQDYGVDVVFRLKQKEGGFKTFASTVGENADLLDAATLEKAFGGETQMLQGKLNGKPVAIYANHVLDYSGKAIGVVELAADRGRFVAAIADVRNIALAIGLAALLIGLAMSWRLAQTIVRPLGGEPHEAIAAFGKIAAGDLTAEVPVKPGDNDSLMVAAKRMRDDLRRMMVDLSQTGEIGRAHV
jgi:methyl-accepting chemotaxis protein